VRREYDAFVDRLRQHPKLANKTDKVVRLNNDGTPVRANYIVAIPSAPSELNDKRFTAPQRLDSARFFSFDVKVVAVDADGVLDLAEAVQAQLIRHRIVGVEGILPGFDLLPGEDVIPTETVVGRVCDPIQLSNDEVEEGRVRYDAKARLYYVTLTFEFWSREV
jgi:hypothetical protein